MGMMWEPYRGTDTGVTGRALFGILAPASRRPPRPLQGPDGGPDEGVGG